LLLTVLLLGMILGGVVHFLANLGRSLQSESAVVGSVSASLVPARDQLAAAAACQAELLADAAAATGVFVLGGSYEQGPDTATLLPTTDTSFVPTSLAGASPVTLQSPARFRAALAGASFEAAGDAGSFTLFFLENASVIRSVVQVRRAVSAAHVLWTVNYFRNGVLQDGSTGTARLSYRFATTAADAAAFTDPPGARHHWLRLSETWSIAEHLGVRVVLPDPTQSPVSDGQGGVVSSRFIHYLPTRKS
jgi:hypothetical protein